MHSDTKLFLKPSLLDFDKQNCFDLDFIVSFN